MANRQTYVIGALGVLVGMVVGASSAQRADMVSYSGHNPNSDIVRNMPNLRKAAGIFRSRSERQTLDVRDGVIFRLTAPRRSSTEVNVANRRKYREGQRGITTHYSASDQGTVRGVPAQRRMRVRECDVYSGTRYTRCVEAYINDDIWQPNYFSN